MTEPTPSDEEIANTRKWIENWRQGVIHSQIQGSLLYAADIMDRHARAMEARLAEAKADIVAESAKRDKCIDTINIQMDRAEKAAASLAEMTKDLSASREREAQRQEKIGAWLAWYKDDGPEKEYADGHLLWNELLEALSPSGPGGKEEGS